MLKMEVANLFCMSLVSACEQKLFRLYLSFTKGSHRRFVFFFLLPFASSFKIFINVITFLYVNAKSKEISAEILFPSFFRKMLMSAFLLRFKANYLEKMRGYP